MKRYYICEAVQYIEPVNGKSEKFAMVARETENDALIVYHDKMSAARKTRTLPSRSCMLWTRRAGISRQTALSVRSRSRNLRKRKRMLRPMTRTAT